MHMNGSDRLFDEACIVPLFI